MQKIAGIGHRCADRGGLFEDVDGQRAIASREKSEAGVAAAADSCTADCRSWKAVSAGVNDGDGAVVRGERGAGLDVDGVLLDCVSEFEMEMALASSSNSFRPTTVSAMTGWSTRESQDKFLLWSVIGPFVTLHCNVMLAMDKVIVVKVSSSSRSQRSESVLSRRPRAQTRPHQFCMSWLFQRPPNKVD
jgi:hypothetical protein